MQIVGAAFFVLIAILGLMSLRKPHYAAGIVILMFSLEQVLQSFVPLLASHTWVTNVAIGLIALGAVMARFARNEPLFEGYFNPVFLLIVGIYIYQVVSMVWSPGVETATANFRKNIPYLVLYIFMLPMLVRNIDEFAATARFIMVFGLIVVLMILLNPSAGFTGARFRVDVGVTSEVYANPLATAGTGGIVALTAVLAHFPKKSYLLLGLRIAAFGAGMAMAILSGSRGQAFGAALVIILFYPLARRIADPKQFFIVTGGFLAVVASVYFAFSLFLVSENEGRFTDGVSDSLSERWDRVILMLETYINAPQSWLTGIGPGGYNYLTGSAYTHNVPIEVFVELGLIGLTLFSTALLLIFFTWRKMFRAVAWNPPMRSAAAILAGYFFYNFLLSCKQGSIIGSVGPMAYFLIIGQVSYNYVRNYLTGADADYASEDPDDDMLEEYDYSTYGDFTDYGDVSTEPAT